MLTRIFTLTISYIVNIEKTEKGHLEKQEQYTKYSRDPTIFYYCRHLRIRIDKSPFLYPLYGQNKYGGVFVIVALNKTLAMKRE